MIEYTVRYFIQNIMNQPVKPKQTRRVFEVVNSSMTGEDAGKYLSASFKDLATLWSLQQLEMFLLQLPRQWSWRLLSLGSFVIHIKLKESMDSQEARFSKFKENLPSCTLNVIPFPEQGVEIRTLQQEMRAHPIQVSFCSVFKNFID